MKICQVNPGCGIPIPPPSWGAIEKIVWELTCNLKELGHEVDIKWANEIKKGDYIKFENNDFGFERNFRVKITSIHNYNSFEEYLLNETLEKKGLHSKHHR